MKKVSLFLLAVFLMFGMAGCGGDGDDASRVNVEGRWNAILSGYTFLLQLYQDGSRLSGTLTETTPGSDQLTIEISGNIDGNSINFGFLVETDKEPVTGTFTGTVDAAGEHMQGTFLASDGTRSSWEATRQ